MYGRHIADLQIYLREAGMENYIWGRYKNQGNFWRYTNVTVFGNNYTVRTKNETIILYCVTNENKLLLTFDA